MLDDWGDLVGLKGSGSHSLRFDDCRIPADWAIEANMIDVDVEGGTPGSELHGNPMYAGRGMAIFTMSLVRMPVNFTAMPRSRSAATTPRTLTVVDSAGSESSRSTGVPGACERVLARNTPPSDRLVARWK